MPTLIAIAVVEQDGRFLIGQRPPGVPLAGLWEFPGGKVEPGESPQDAAVRECREETGLEVLVIDEYPPQEQRYEHGQVDLRFFRCLPMSQSIPVVPYRWVDRCELSQYEFPAGNHHLLAILSERSKITSKGACTG